MTSIRTRLLWALLTLVAAVSLLVGLLTYRRVLMETSTLLDYQLRQMALSLRSQVSLAPRIEVPPDQGDTDYVVQIWDLLGARVYQSRPGLPLIDHETIGFSDMQLQHRLWRVYGLQTVDGVIQIAQPVRVRQSLASTAALRVAFPLLLLMPILGVAIVWVAGTALAPLQRAVLEVQRRDAGSLLPLGTGGIPLEVLPLIEELNRLLQRLDAAFTTQRAFIADAAHELRSPLTALRLQLQLFDRAPDEAARAAAREQLGAAVERATHLIGQLLTLARNEPRGAATPLQPVLLETAVVSAITDTHAFAQARRITLGLDAGPDLRVAGDLEALRVLARNLIDNAVRYTPEDGRVDVAIRQAGQAVMLEVTDSGPGIPVEDRERAFDRFYRRVGQSQEGTGLGLAIVKVIADRHGAQLQLADAPAGGFRITASFPIAV